jgi:hypothetical protein
VMIEILGIGLDLVHQALVDGQGLGGLGLENGRLGV